MDGHTARATRQWAYETFGHLEVGNRLRSRRVVAMAAALASRPAPTVSAVFKDVGAREGAYRLLSNASVSTHLMIDAMSVATVSRCAEHAQVFVAVDGSSISLRDPRQLRDVGKVGAWRSHGRGLQVLTALAMDPEGVPIGVCSQRWWAREARSTARAAAHFVGEKETRYFVDVVREVHARMQRLAPKTRAVLVMDRGFDCWPVLRTASEGVGFIVRAEHDRRLVPASARAPDRLRRALEASPVLGRYVVHVPEAAGRAARTARMSVRARRVTLRLKVGRKRREPLTLNAVLAREIGGPKTGALSWMLLTTESVDTFEQAQRVIAGYSHRWRIEELHRAWKRGGGHVEDTQLRSREGIIKWATLHCAVAARATRLAHLARTQPTAPASEQFTQDEIDAAIVLRGKRTKLKMGTDPPLGELVRLVADLGGYTGKSSGGPPGPTVIGRGLEQVATAAAVVAALRRT